MEKADQLPRVTPLGELPVDEVVEYLARVEWITA